MWFSQVINKIYLKIKLYISWFYIIAIFNNIIILVWKYIILLHWVCYSYMDTRWTLTQANFGECRRAVLLFSFKTSMLINQGWNLKVMTRHFHHCELYNHLVTMNIDRTRTEKQEQRNICFSNIHYHCSKFRVYTLGSFIHETLTRPNGI